MNRKSYTRRMTAIICALTSVLLVSSVTAQGALIFQGGTTSLLPNQAGQQVTFSINNTGAAQEVTGLEFWVQIGDGYPNVPGSSVVNDGPNLTGINLINGTAFSGNNSGQTDFIFSQLANSVGGQLNDANAASYEFLLIPQVLIRCYDHVEPGVLSSLEKRAVFSSAQPRLNAVAVSQLISAWRTR